ncbi:MAG: hypothetical protein JRH07_10565 [Deltaproteobacteria bacterium]|nr:hypothetical protein [Deltaproteobacteria bacterium]
MENTVKTVSVTLAPTWELATQLQPHLTVEAEYGSRVLEGSRFTAAHHQPQGPFSSMEQPAPCNNPKIPRLEAGENIVVSHLDLDTIGGVGRGVGHPAMEIPGTEGFWELAEFVDLHGPHMLTPEAGSPEDQARLRAWWAWAKVNIPRLPRDAVTDVTALVLKALDFLQSVLLGKEPEAMAAGRAMAEAEDHLNTESFLRLEGEVVVRKSDEFVNHLYRHNGGALLAKGVAALNSKTGAVTISLAAPIEGVSCRKIVQEIWGPEAGGHDGIAGSPRGQEMTDADLDRAAAALAAAIAKAVS